MMDENDRKRFGFIMAGMADNFRDSISREGMRMRFEMLKEFTIEEVERAAKAIMARRKYTKMPPIAEFLEEMKPKEPQIEDRAQVMATKILDHLRTKGSRIKPDLSEDPIADVLMTKRWPYLIWAQNLLESEIKWWVKEFCEAYRSHCNIESTNTAIDAPKRFKELACGIGNM
jgi:hypothetical protein